MKILESIRRFKTSGALPWGPSQADQDAFFWESLDVVEATLAELEGGAK